MKSALAEAFEIKKDRYKYETLGKHKTCLSILFNISPRTRLRTQKAARNLGMDVIVLDVNQGAWKLETCLLYTSCMISWMSVCNSSMVGVCCGNEYNLFKRYCIYHVCPFTD